MRKRARRSNPGRRTPEPARWPGMTLGGSSGWRRHAMACAVTLALGALVPADASPPGLRQQPEARIFAQWAVAADGPRAVSSASAQTWTASNCNDAGAGSLRDMLAQAGDGDTVDLGQLPCAAIVLQGGALLVGADDIHLLGPGADRLAIDGGGADRVLIDPHDGLTVSGLTIRNGANRTTGYHVAGGGCIAAAGQLTLVDSVVTGCLAAGEGAYGGALYAYSLGMQGSSVTDSIAYGILPGTGTAANGGAGFVYRVDLVDSTISGNRASHYPDPPRSHYDVGGGLMVVRGGSIHSSTFNGNQAGERGGAINSLNDLAIANSTLAGNAVTGGRGGAIYMRWPAHLALNNVTIANNLAAEGGGVHLNAQGAHLVSTLVYDNRATAVAGSDAFSSTAPTAVSGSHNLIGPGHDQVTLPADTVAGDPRLGPLAAHGGRTLTMGLWPGSAAHDAGANPLNEAFDQRGAGFPRVRGAAPDIGAFEGTLSPFVPVPLLSGRVLALLAALLGAAALLARLRRPQTRRRSRPDRGTMRAS